jgi:GTPase involved in cell partitioning and DNA repair
VGILPAARGDGGKGTPVLGVAVQAIATAVKKRAVQVSYPDRGTAGKLPGRVAVQARIGRDADEWLVAVPAPFDIRMEAAKVARRPDRGGSTPGAPGQQHQQHDRNASGHPASCLRQWKE